MCLGVRGSDQHCPGPLSDFRKSGSEIWESVLPWQQGPVSDPEPKLQVSQHGTLKQRVYSYSKPKEVQKGSNVHTNSSKEEGARLRREKDAPLLQ